MTIRLGGPVFHHTDDPEEWAEEHRRLGYRAAYCPEDPLVSDAPARRALQAALSRRDIVLAEVGAWVNPFDPNPAQRRENCRYIAERLALADELGARCCVDIVGAVDAPRWDAASAAGYSEEFFDAVVETFRAIIDSVAPTRTAMAFEAMPYNFLDGPAEYERLLRAINRPGQVGVHVDLCNMITDARRYFGSAELARSVFERLGPLVRSVHLKDLALDDLGATVKFHEVMPGTGGVDLEAYLRCAASLPDCPVMLEHLEGEAAYDTAREAVRGIAARAGIPVEGS